ncbi:DUF402 domain-containing protein [Mycoplasma leonicaptivi]|uniref:DUF402 domain-containing protein n=1 Tax=Mycoplasma leonicaptivi TaxID=36742 RepID=UPI000566D038|nr:DUF402 domain-containing protein [Mycoplasma leonicaptivi]
MEWDFSDIKVGMIINVQAYKHNSQLYRQWCNAKVIFHNKKHIVLSLKGTRVIESFKVSKGWTYKDDALWFIPKKSFYNSIVMLKKNYGNLYYINLASYPIFEDNTIKFIDYDLDLKSYPNKDLQIVDKDEFHENAKKYKYSLNIKNKIFNEVQNLVSLYSSNQYFFKEDILKYYIQILYNDKLISESQYLMYLNNGKKSLLEETSMFKKFNNLKNNKKIRY